MALVPARRLPIAGARKIIASRMRQSLGQSAQLTLHRETDVTALLEHRRAAAIVERYGHTSLSAMALLPDKSYWFSEGGSLVAYSVSGGMAVVLGDPIGPAEDRSACVRAFAAYAGRNGWRPVYYETDEGTDPAYRALGYASVCIGHEAIVRLDTFSLSGRSHKNIRNRINRLTEEGLTTEVLRAPQSARTLRALRDVSDSWLAMVKGSEKRFSMGWFDDAYIGRCDVMVVRSRHGRIVAFANIVSEYQAPEATIDLMRYRPESPAGVMDLLFVRLFEWARENGLSAFNLGLSPLAKLAEGPESGVSERVLRLVYEHGNAFYGFRGLHEYKQKFGPDWQPRYLVYPDPAALPAALAAATRLNSGENPVTGYIATALRLPRRRQGAAASA